MLHWPFSAYSIQRTPYDPKALSIRKKKKLVRGRGSLGKRLLEICRNADLRILNARVSGDSLGRATFYGKAGISVVDFVICDQTLFSHILNFIVKEPRYLSDHSPLMT